jgi:hypothetical protein
LIMCDREIWLTSFRMWRTPCDAIFLMDILGLLEKHEVVDLLGLARNVLSDHGRLIVHVPNAEGLFGMRIR